MSVRNGLEEALALVDEMEAACRLYLAELEAYHADPEQQYPERLLDAVTGPMRKVVKKLDNFRRP